VELPLIRISRRVEHSSHAAGSGLMRRDDSYFNTSGSIFPFVCRMKPAATCPILPAEKTKQPWPNWVSFPGLEAVSMEGGSKTLLAWG